MKRNLFQNLVPPNRISSKRIANFAFAVLLLSGLSTQAYAVPAFGNVRTDVSSPVQKHKISGTVVGGKDKEPLIGATVVVKGTTTGTITDLNGHFDIEVASDNAVLVVAFLGYNKQEVPVSGQTTLTITLLEDDNKLDEVVVIGYGVQKKKLNTGATVQVKGDLIQKQNTSTALGALQGISPGVQIVKSSGQPGSDFKINIRGIGTAGDSRPLYIVDGIPMGSIDYLSPNDIESIDVLKDAASAAIYGSRGGNGVILVTTKKGKSGKATISYESYYGVQNVYKTAPTLNAKEYIAIMNESELNSGRTPTDFSKMMPNYADVESGKFTGTNWLKEMTNSNAPIQSHSLSVAGGSDRSIYSFGLSSFEQKGIIGKPVEANFKRYSARLNAENVLIKSDKLDVLKLGENLTYTYTQNNGIQTGNIYSNDIHSALVVSPLLQNKDADGNYYKGIAWDPQSANPIGTMEYRRGQNISKSHKMVGSVYAELQVIKDLKFKTSFGLTLDGSSYRSYVPIYDLAEGNNKQTYDETTQNMTLGTSWIFENTLTYAKKIGDHNISLLAGTSAEHSWIGDAMGSYNRNSNFNKGLDYAYLNNALTPNAGYTAVYGSPYTGSNNATGDDLYGDQRMISYFGRVSYDYKETYMLTGIIRRDGSSNFAPGGNHRWGIFPSVSAGWVMSNEAFLKPYNNIVDYLKVRGSFGTNGNNKIRQFQYLATIGYTNASYFFGTDKNSSTVGAYADILPNTNITWETSQQTSLGLDARFLNSRLSLSFDWYKKVTKDWLLVAPILAIYGTNPPVINGGDIENKGYELTLGWNDKFGDFNYSVQGNVAFNKNKVTRIANSEGIIHGEDHVLSQGTSEMYRAQVGYPLAYFYGYKTAGIFQNEAEVNAYVNKDGKAIIPGAQPGDVKFVDVDGDGVITQADRTEIGDPNPDMTYGLTLSANWKGFDFALTATGVAGNQIAKSYRSFADSYKNNYTTDIFNRWHGEGTSNTYPRLLAGSHINTSYISDIYIEDGDYLRISNITFGYDFKRLLKKLPVSQLRAYASVQNLYTFTGYSGMDPEVGYGPGFSKGIDLGFYPSARTVMFGLSVNF